MSFPRFGLDRADRELLRRVNASLVDTIRIRLPDLVAGNVSMGRGSHTFSASYDATNGESIDLPAVPGRTDVQMLAQQDVYFLWDEATDGMRVYDIVTGTEIAGAVDLSHLTTVAYAVLGTRPEEQPLYVGADSHVLGARIVFGNALTEDNDSYWDLSLVVNEAAGPVVELATLSLAKIAFAGQASQVLYAPEQPYLLQAGDVLTLKAEASDVIPPALVSPLIEIDIQRRA